MKTLILPDIHNKVALADAIIAQERADRIVCLGDYFDSYDEASEDHIHTAQWLKKTLARFESTFTGLVGNHDLPYRNLNSRFTHCPGFTKQKKIDIRRELSQIEFNKLRWFTWVDGWLLTHAGLSLINALKNIGNEPYTQEVVSEALEKEARLAEAQLSYGAEHWFYHCGRARGGDFQHGGIVWNDFRQEFVPLSGIRQIVGHTFTRIPCCIKGNWNIDCNLRYYAIIENGTLTTKEAPCRP